MDLFGFDDQATVDDIEVVSQKPQDKISLEKPLEKTGEPMSINEIQQLLINGLQSNDSSNELSSFADESTIYDEDSGISKEECEKNTRPLRNQKPVLDDIQNISSESCSLSPGEKTTKKSENKNEFASAVKENQSKKKGKRKKIDTQKLKDNNEDLSRLIENTENDRKVVKPAKSYARPTRNRKPVLQDIINYSLEDDTNTTDVTFDTTIVKRKREIKKKTKNKKISDENDERVENLAAEINNQFRQVEEFQLLVE